ncbi:MAG: hypothetical protein IAI49_00905 [Candidatus Eremiobacteraeota bacterium]|nr:hypothetical protein [Candidatus Eremiobacteraeota bacterium]
MQLAIASHNFSGGGTVRCDERRAALRPLPSATFSPASAAKAGLGAGDVVDLVAGSSVLRDLVVALEPGAGSDIVTVIDGLPDAPANGFAGGETVTIRNVRSARAALAGALS